MSSDVSLRSIYLFNHLSDERLAEIEATLVKSELKKGEILFNMGDPGDVLYIVASGSIAIFAPNPENPAEEKPIRLFLKEEALGEMALIDKKPRSLSARAEEDSVLLALDDANFRHFVDKDTDLAYAVMNGLSDRIRYTTTFLNEVRTWVSKVSQGQYQDNDAFMDEVRGWVKQISEGDVEEGSIKPEKYQDETLSTLAAEFAQMAAQVKKREDELKKKIVTLEIKIDQTKRKEEVDKIAGSDMFTSLREKAARMREDLESDDD